MFSSANEKTFSQPISNGSHWNIFIIVVLSLKAVRLSSSMLTIILKQLSFDYNTTNMPSNLTREKLSGSL